MFGFIKRMFIVLLNSLVNASNNTKCVSLSNQKRTIQRTLINLHPDKDSRKLHYYLFTAKLERWG